ncbi:MAG: PEP-CTERM sorting domain-containing protein [Candidatus Accumulibacter necessarius]|jgi:hypothetical protein|uniref:cohesin domain-containing protein n=1 Tax=Candidatus Accumulibacter necessarius TaxID=2954386 RepID=UPI002FC2C9AB
MKTTHLSRALFGAVLAGLVFLSGAASAYTLSFSPSTQDVGLGRVATVDVRIAGIFPGTPNQDDGLGAYDFDVVYDPAIIRFKKATDGFSLGTSIGLGVDDNGQSGRLTVSDFSLEPVPDLLVWQTLLVRQDGTMRLFSIEFDTLLPGTTLLEFKTVTLGNVWGDPRTPTLSTGSITVLPAAVPEPGTLALLAGAGLITLGGRRFRRVRTG